MKSCFLNLNAKSECFFVFKFHNNRIYFSALNDERDISDDERDISDFSNSSNDDFQKFLTTNIRRCC